MATALENIAVESARIAPVFGVAVGQPITLRCNGEYHAGRVTIDCDKPLARLPALNATATLNHSPSRAPRSGLSLAR